MAVYQGGGLFWGGWPLPSLSLLFFYSFSQALLPLPSWRDAPSFGDVLLSRACFRCRIPLAQPCASSADLDPYSPPRLPPVRFARFRSPPGEAGERLLPPGPGRARRPSVATRTSSAIYPSPPPPCAGLPSLPCPHFRRRLAPPPCRSSAHVPSAPSRRPSLIPPPPPTRPPPPPPAPPPAPARPPRAPPASLLSPLPAALSRRSPPTSAFPNNPTTPPSCLSRPRRSAALRVSP